MTTCLQGQLSLKAPLHPSDELNNEYIALAEGPQAGYMSICFGHLRIAYLNVALGRVLNTLPKAAEELGRALAQ